MLCADDTENKKQPEFYVEPVFGNYIIITFNPKNRGNYNEKEVAISRNLLILSAPELGLEPRTL